MSKAPRKIFSIRLWDSLPPPPWASCTRGYSDSGSGQLSAKPPGPLPPRGLSSLIAPRRPARGGRSGSRRRRRPRWTPSARRAGAPACSACRTPRTRAASSGPAGSRPRCTRATPRAHDLADVELALGVEVRVARGAAGSRCAGISPMPRHLRSQISKTSAPAAPAPAGCPRASPTRAYWFSTSARPSSSAFRRHVGRPAAGRAARSR